VRHVFHLAAQTIVGTANRSPLSTFESNIRGTYNAAGGLPAVVGGVERSSSPPRTRPTGRTRSCPTRRTSRSADLPLRRLEGRDRPDRALVRHDLRHADRRDPAGQHLRRRRRELAAHRPDTARRCSTGGAPVIRSDGSPERDYLYVQDAVVAYLAIADSLEREDWGPREERRNRHAGQRSRDRRALIEITGKDLEADVPGHGHATRRDRPPVPRLDEAALADGLGAGVRPACRSGSDRRLVQAVPAGARDLTAR
jgi:CDP-glucose 4,6-dehydratase